MTWQVVSLVVASLGLPPAISCSSRQSALAPCPGEGPRYGDFKCDHDRTHRVCAKLVENRDTCEELSFPSEGRELSFWEITGQQRWNWKDKICGGPNPGTNWCICMWATANLVAEVGCTAVELDCAATDVEFILASDSDGGWRLGGLQECLRDKCEQAEDGGYRNRQP